MLYSIDAHNFFMASMFFLFIAMICIVYAIGCHISHNKMQKEFDKVDLSKINSKYDESGNYRK